MAMAELPEELFIAAVKEIVATDAGWFPQVEGGALYLRPFMYASEVFLGVKPAAEYHFLVIASPVGTSFKSVAPAVSLLVSEDYTRAAPGGPGAAKCCGNSAPRPVAPAAAIPKGNAPAHT